MAISTFGMSDSAAQGFWTTGTPRDSGLDGFGAGGRTGTGAIDRGFFDDGRVGASFSIGTDGDLSFIDPALDRDPFADPFSPSPIDRFLDVDAPGLGEFDPSRPIIRPTPTGTLVTGTPQDDRLVGGDEDDFMDGRGGDDELFGAGGADVLIGAAGDDLLLGGEDGDVALGGAGQDELHGGTGDDLLFGGAGDDALFGQAGDDTLSGDAGADLFVFSGLDGDDVIVDFDAADGDLIALEPGLRPTVLANDAGEAVVVLSDTDSVTLLGVAADDVGSDWFVVL